MQFSSEHVVVTGAYRSWCVGLYHPIVYVRTLDCKSGKSIGIINTINIISKSKSL